jgi:hypothetical protein
VKIVFFPTFPRLAPVADCGAETVNQDKIFCVHKSLILPYHQQWRKTCVGGSSPFQYNLSNNIGLSQFSFDLKSKFSGSNY